MKRVLFYAIALFLVLHGTMVTAAHAQEKKYYFFRSLDYGSEAMFHPVGIGLYSPH
jgi:hypothetical protein